MIHNIPQPTFEQFVATRLKRDGEVEVRKNHSYVSCEQVRNFEAVMIRKLIDIEDWGRSLYQSGGQRHWQNLRDPLATCSSM